LLTFSLCLRGGLSDGAAFSLSLSFHSVPRRIGGFFQWTAVDGFVVMATGGQLINRCCGWSAAFLTFRRSGVQHFCVCVLLTSFVCRCKRCPCTRRACDRAMGHHDCNYTLIFLPNKCGLGLISFSFGTPHWQSNDRAQKAL
jgi:hypothetical protein